MLLDPTDRIIAVRLGMGKHFVLARNPTAFAQVS